MKKYPRPPSSNRWDQFEKLTTDNNKVIEMLLRDKELKAIYSKVGNIIIHHHSSTSFRIHRGYYAVARRYECYVRVARTISHE